MILSIETSCDDSSVAVLDSQTLQLKFHKKISQELDHSVFGGVVPELAARLHTQALPDIIHSAREFFPHLKAIAVTNAPGLSVSLLIGVSAAKALSLALGVPLISVNHLIGHIFSLFLQSEARLPLGVLLVSGGHTLVLDINEKGSVQVLAATGDDSFGESFDKVAKMLGLGYPGGAVVERLSNAWSEKSGGSNSVLTNPKTPRLKFTIPLLHDERMEFSFSGLKNQTRLAIVSGEFEKEEICHAFQTAAVSHICDKLGKLFAQKRWQNFGVVGGASANGVLRGALGAMCEAYGAGLLFAPLEFCSDNAAMIARAGREKLLRGRFCALNELQIAPKTSLNGVNLFEF